MFSPASAPNPVAVGDGSLTLAEFEKVCDGHPVVLGESARVRMRASERQLAAAIELGATVYGVTTGYGARSDEVIPPERRAAFQLATIRSHACGSGPPASWSQARGVWLAKLASLATGRCGASEALATSIVQLLNSKWAPVVPVAGSLGASGDLIPSAHAALVLAGEGEVVDRDGQTAPGAKALLDVDLAPIKLGDRDGLSLVNGTAMTLALAIHALTRAERLIGSADALVAATLEAFGGHRDAFSSEIVSARPHPGAESSAAAIRAGLVGARFGVFEAEGLHDSYAWRCAPQVHGSARSAWQWASATCEIELDSCTDNPIVTSTGELVSGGNFHAAPLGLVMDALVLALGEVAALSRQRLVRMAEVAGGDQAEGIGLTMLVTTATASLLELSATAPATGRWLPLDRVEDHVSNATLAARRGLLATELVAHVLATEAVALRSLGRPGDSDAARWAAALVDRSDSNVDLALPLHATIGAVASELLLANPDGTVDRDRPFG